MDKFFGYGVIDKNGCPRSLTWGRDDLAAALSIVGKWNNEYTTEQYGAPYKVVELFYKTPD